MEFSQDRGLSLPLPKPQAFGIKRVQAHPAQQRTMSNHVRGCMCEAKNAERRRGRRGSSACVPSLMRNGENPELTSDAYQTERLVVGLYSPEINHNSYRIRHQQKQQRHGIRLTFNTGHSVTQLLKITFLVHPYQHCKKLSATLFHIVTEKVQH